MVDQVPHARSLGGPDRWRQSSGLHSQVWVELKGGNCYVSPMAGGTRPGTRVGIHVRYDFACALAVAIAAAANLAMNVEGNAEAQAPGHGGAAFELRYGGGNLANPDDAGAVESQEAGVPTSPVPLGDKALVSDSYDDVVAVGSVDHFRCTGVFVATDWVLTARHCLPANRVMQGYDALSPRMVHVVDRHAVGPGHLDVALLHLSSRVPVDTLHPRRRAGHYTPPNGILRLVGYGALDASGRRGFGWKRKIDIPTTSWGCDENRSRTLKCDMDNEFVIPSSGGRDTCDGDSGGPAFEYLDGWRLVGITSRAIATARVRCGDGGVYVRIDKLDRWIEATLSRKESKR